MKAGANKSHIVTDLSDQLILASNLLAVDADTLSYWAKTAFGEWPTSVQFAPEADKAIIKLPSSADTCMFL